MAVDKGEKYVHQPFPGWRYGPKEGDAAIFNSEEEVPEGWTDNPNDFKDGKRVKEAPAKDLTQKAPEKQEGPLKTSDELVEAHSHAELAAILDEMKKSNDAIEYLPGWNKKQLADLIVKFRAKPEE